ncbi:eamA-like transporter family protein [Lysobacter antibioticus]|uniref:EamA-like transporter family protein n=1 Tax=Lysobacter antibioticus TaxID=84531 RepID=A0A0S2FGJ1_LYSAN|nr:eamA-like transporter family protein [Lysobacter antibioticus]
MALRAGLMASASICLALLALLSRYTRGLPPELVTWLRFMIPGLCLVALARREDWRAVWSGADRPGWVRAVCVVISQGCFVLAAMRGDLLHAVLLYNTGPLFIPLIARVWLGERLRPAALTGLAIGFAGVLVVLQPAARGLDSTALISLFGGFAMAASQVLFYRSAQHQPPFRNQFKLYMQASMVGLPLAALGLGHLPSQPFTTESTTVLVLALLGMSLCSLGSQSLRDLAYRGMDNASTLAPLMYVAVPVSAALDWLLFAHAARLSTLAGAGLIVIGAVAALRSGARAKRG